MQYIWAEGDILVGRRVMAWNDTEEYIIGYDPSAVIGGSGQKYMLVSLIDGMGSCMRCTRKALADFLNEAKSKPMDIRNPE
jgi:hypothetical protein